MRALAISMFSGGVVYSPLDVPELPVKEVKIISFRGFK